MNKRLKELGKQARDYAYVTEVDKASAPTWFDLYEQKLAELIIADCIDAYSASYTHFRPLTPTTFDEVLLKRFK